MLGAGVNRLDICSEKAIRLLKAHKCQNRIVQSLAYTVGANRVYPVGRLRPSQLEIFKTLACNHIAHNN